MFKNLRSPIMTISDVREKLSTPIVNPPAKFQQESTCRINGQMNRIGSKVKRGHWSINEYDCILPWHISILFLCCLTKEWVNSDPAGLARYNYFQVQFRNQHMREALSLTNDDWIKTSSTFTIPILLLLYVLTVASIQTEPVSTTNKISVPRDYLRNVLFESLFIAKMV